jgi:hypothetical protein
VTDKLFKYIEVSREMDQRTGSPCFVVRGVPADGMPAVEVCRTVDDSPGAKLSVTAMAQWWSAQVVPLNASS